MTNLRKGNRAPLGRAPVTLYETEMLRTRAERKGGQKMNKHYKGFLNSQEWKTISEARKKMDGNKCTRCGSSNRLEVHHMSYYLHPQKGLLDLNNLITLCHKCHSSTHGKCFGMRELDELSFCKSCAWMNDQAGPCLCLRTMSPFFGEYVDREMVCDWYWPWPDVSSDCRKGHWSDEEAQRFRFSHNQGEEEFNERV